MEAVLALIVGLFIGFVVGWLAMKLRASGNMSRLEAETKLERQRMEEIERANSRLQQESNKWQTQAMDNGMEVASLQAQLLSANQNIEDARLANDELRAEIRNRGDEANENAKKVVKLQTRLDAADKRLAEQTDIENTMLDQFRVAASDIVANNNKIFLATADEKIGTLVKQTKNDFDFSKEAVRDLVKPLSDELKRIENERNQSQGSLIQQIKDLSNNNKALEQETRNLSTALKRPEVRGSWGEIQLRRVVELAGMSNHCDFSEQVSVSSGNGSSERPDMVVNMPNQRTIVIDAKTPLNAYLTALELTTDEERQQELERHSQQVRERAQGLAKKSYWRLFKRSPEFVVMFLPGEFFLQPALEKYPNLMEESMEQKVVIATPSTLVALLKTVEMGWREAQLAEEAAKIGELGQQLHDRLYTFANHMENMRKSLSSTVNHFNSGVGSLERRILPSARRFKELGVQSSKEISLIQTIDESPQQIRSATNTPALTDTADN